MKNLLLLLLIVPLMVGCNLSDDVLFQKNSDGLLGQWVLVETSYSLGAELLYNEVKNGGQYTFLADGTFTSSRLDDCGRGRYELKDEEVTLTYDCDTDRLPNPFVYSLLIKNDYFILSPRSVRCIEGCPSRFKKKVE